MLLPHSLEHQDCTSDGEVTGADDEGIPSKHNTGRLFIGMGSRNAYVMAIDLVYAGVVETPEPAALANILFEEKLGSYKILKEFGLLPKGAGDPKLQFADVFLRVKSGLEEELGPILMQKMDWDLFTYEHALCKFGMSKVMKGLYKQK